MPRKPKAAPKTPGEKPKTLKNWTVIIPAHNEQLRVGRVIRDVRSWRDAHTNKENIRVLVVSDGSTDATHRVALDEGAEAIHSDPKDPYHNMGKADAVKAGVLHADKRHKADVIVTLDADLRDINPQSIDALINPVLSDKYHMSVGKTSEGSQMSLPESGNRAILTSALRPWIRGNPKWKPLKGYGLEKGLNRLIPKSKQKFLDSGDLFIADEAFRRSSERQDMEVRDTLRGLDERNHPLYMAGKLRAQGKNKEARDYVADWHSKRGEKPPYMKTRDRKGK